MTYVPAADRYERMRYNSAISSLMALTTEVQRGLDSGAVPGPVLRDATELLVLMLGPIAPHIAEELWREPLGHPETLVHGPWPEWDEALAREEEVVMVIQVDGRVRDRVSVPADNRLARQTSCTYEIYLRVTDSTIVSESTNHNLLYTFPVKIVNDLP